MGKRKADANGDGTPDKKSKPAAEVQAPFPAGFDFTSQAKTAEGKDWNLKIVSWNVNGIRAWLSKGGLDYVKAENPDIITLQETKCDRGKIPAECDPIEGYLGGGYFCCAEKSGYSGVALYSKKEPLGVKMGIDIEEHDKEGRVITAEYDTFYLVTTYVPNAGAKLVRLDYRSKEWDVAFRNYIAGLEEKKPVILTGDLNVAHQEIDLKNPKSNKNKSAGFTDAEREGLTCVLEAGYVDSFRHFYPDKKDAYTYWTFMGNARAKNVGWRLDYFIVSEKLKDKMADSLIRSEVMGSDHCPVVMLMDMPGESEENGANDSAAE